MYPHRSSMVCPPGELQHSCTPVQAVAPAREDSREAPGKATDWDELTLSAINNVPGLSRFFGF